MKRWQPWRDSERPKRSPAHRGEPECRRISVTGTYQGISGSISGDQAQGGNRLLGCSGLCIEAYELDIALVASQTRDEDLRSQLLMHGRVMAVMRPRTPFAGRHVVHIQELSGEHLFILTAKSELRERVVAASRRFTRRTECAGGNRNLGVDQNMAGEDRGGGSGAQSFSKKKEAA